MLERLETLDLAIYTAIAKAPTPRLDHSMRWLGNAADYSRLSIAAAAGMAAFGGERGRRSAVSGLAAVGAGAAVLNLIAKPLWKRPRPDRTHVPEARHIRMPTSTSFPSGHTGAAFAFATGVAHRDRAAAGPLWMLAGAVGYSRVHTGVHFPGDVLAGALMGMGIARASTWALDRVA